MREHINSSLFFGLIIIFAAPIVLISCQENSQQQKHAGVSKQKGDIPMSIKVESSAFVHNGRIPKKYTGDGRDMSVPLNWSNIPQGTKELALICDDPDAPTPQPWVHWVIYKIPSETTSLQEGIPHGPKLRNPKDALQGKNSFGNIGYNGPSPPKGHGVHHYHFRLYALDTKLEINAGLDKEQLLKAMDGHIIAEGEIVGTYERK